MTGIYQFAYEIQDTPGPGEGHSLGGDDKDSPESKHPARKRMENDWLTCRDLAQGQRAVVQARTRYLPRHVAEDNEDYNIRLQHAELYNGFRRTMIAGVGLVMQTPPRMSDDAPDEFKKDWENIDGGGTHGDVFSARLDLDATVTGLAGILVEYPKVANPTAIDSAEEARRGLRPYWVPICAEQFISWRHVKVDGTTVLTQLVLREDVEEEAGAFGVAQVCQFRVFRREVTREFDSNGVKIVTVSPTVQWELWRKDGPNEKARRVDNGVISGIDEIAFSALVVGNDVSGFECSPPLIDLAYVNLAHYRVTTDRRHLMHIGCVPVPVRTGWKSAQEESSGPTKIGPNTLMDLPHDGDFKFAEITGAAFTPSEKDIDKLESRMGSLGLSFLAPQTRHAETAEAKRIDATAQSASLSTVAQALQDCLNNAARLHAKFRKLSVVPSFEVNRQFEAIVMDTALVDSLSNMEAKGQLTVETLWAELQKGHILGEDFNAIKEAAALVQKQKDLLAMGGGDPNNPEKGKQPPNNPNKGGAAAGGA